MSRVSVGRREPRAPVGGPLDFVEDDQSEVAVGEIRAALGVGDEDVSTHARADDGCRR